MNKTEKKFTLVALIVKQYWYSESEEEIKSLLKKVKVENEKVDLKKSTAWELQAVFYLEQYEDCSPGDSTSDSSEKLFLKMQESFIFLELSCI